MTKEGQADHTSWGPQVLLASTTTRYPRSRLDGRRLLDSSVSSTLHHSSRACAMVPRSLWWRRVVLVALVGAALCSDDDDDALAVDCTLGRWGEWSTCVDAQQVRHRDIEIPPRLGGKPCEDLTETQKCLICLIWFRFSISLNPYDLLYQ